MKARMVVQNTQWLRFVLLIVLWLIQIRTIQAVERVHLHPHRKIEVVRTAYPGMTPMTILVLTVYVLSPFLDT